MDLTLISPSFTPMYLKIEIELKIDSVKVLMKSASNIIFTSKSYKIG